MSNKKNENRVWKYITFENTKKADSTKNAENTMYTKETENIKDTENTETTIRIKKVWKKTAGMVLIIILSAALLGGCGQKRDSVGSESTQKEKMENTQQPADTDNGQQVSAADSVSQTSKDDSGQQTPDTINADIESGAISGNTGNILELEVRFGDDGEPFLMRLEDNETAKAIARDVGTSDWRLPIYERDDEADFDVMQYYDIPSRYEIPSEPETITQAQAGEVYYSDPNRIVLFYHDAEISEEYTKVGSFEATNAFVEAVEENPVLEGWGNKIVHITAAD